MTLKLIDSHCHIHEATYKLPAKQAISNAIMAGVTKMICVGTDADTTIEAVNFAQDQPGIWASVGLHPHESKLGADALKVISQQSTRPKVVAVGECGLDYYYNHSDKKEQFTALEHQMQLALDLKLPMIFHVREAFEDFWSIYDNFSGIRGVVHSFTATTKELERALSRNLYIGLNGIMTFTKDQNQLEAAMAVPINKLMLETDAPFLTPAPLRGKINEPKNVRLTAEFLSRIRGEKLSELARATTINAEALFGI